MANFFSKLIGLSFLDNNHHETEERLKSVSPEPNDGSITLTVGDNAYADVTGSSYGYSTTFEIDPTITDEASLITRYRELALQSEVEKAINSIIDEFVTTSDNEVVAIDLDEIELSESVKKKIIEEFKHILDKLDFNNSAYEIVRRWYVDGRLQYQVVVDPLKYKNEGIGRLTYLDPRKLKKVRIFKKEREQDTNVDMYTDKKPFYIYTPEGSFNEYSTQGYTTENTPEGIKMSDDAVVQVTSGLLSVDNAVVLSYLHKAIRPANQLKQLEDATIIYRLVRAPERRIFYIDVGNLPAHKAEQVLKRQMQQYKSKTVYNNSSGTVTSDPKFTTMIEDYWLPRRGDGKATEITTLPPGQNLGEMNEVNYFMQKLYNALNVPITRMDPSSGFNLGRSTEISRDEVSFMKFVKRLRRRFAMNFFVPLLQRQLVLKNIMSPAEFEEIKSQLSFEFASDNHFDELIRNEIMTERLNIVDRMMAYRGSLFSQKEIMRDFLMRTQEEIDETRKDIDEELKSKLYPDPNNPLGEEGFEPSAKQVIHKADGANRMDKLQAAQNKASPAPKEADPKATTPTT